MSAAVLVMALAAAPAERGAALFAERCAVCHGEKGKGDGPTAGVLRPPPADLTAARFAPGRVDQVLRTGIEGTAMAAQPGLGPFDRAALVKFVVSLGPPGPPAVDLAAAERGAALFAIRCAACHGKRADGDGPSAPVLGRPAADFTRKQPTRERIVAVLDKGIPGTAMTPMRRLLSTEEVDALVASIQASFGRNDIIGIPPEHETASEKRP